MTCDNCGTPVYERADLPVGADKGFLAVAYTETTEDGKKKQGVMCERCVKAMTETDDDDPLYMPIWNN